MLAINLPPVLPSRLTSVCFVVSGPQSRVPISNGSSNALLNQAVVKEGWNSMWRAKRANPRRRQRNEKNLMRGTTAVPWNKIAQLLSIFIFIILWFSIGHVHFIIGLPVAQPNYKRSQSDPFLWGGGGGFFGPLSIILVAFIPNKCTCISLFLGVEVVRTSFCYELRIESVWTRQPNITY